MTTNVYKHFLNVWLTTYQGLGHVFYRDVWRNLRRCWRITKEQDFSTCFSGMWPTVAKQCKHL